MGGYFVQEVDLITIFGAQRGKVCVARCKTSCDRVEMGLSRDGFVFLTL